MLYVKILTTDAPAATMAHMAHRQKFDIGSGQLKKVEDAKKKLTCL